VPGFGFLQFSKIGRIGYSKRLISKSVSPELKRRIIGLAHWFGFVCHSLSVKHDNEVSANMLNLRRMGKMTGQFWAVCGPTFMTFWDNRTHNRTNALKRCRPRRPLSMHLSDYVYNVSLRIYIYRPLNLPLRCEVVDNNMLV